jgi:hypothetical protein
MVFTWLMAKRATIVVFVAYGLVYVYLARRRFRQIVLVGLVVLPVVAFQTRAALPSEGRTVRALEYLVSGDLDAASGNRWSEAVSAMAELSNSWVSMLAGSGFGASFLPWPDLADYATYRSHYVHFTPLSYAWIGGLLMPFLVYGELFVLAFSLVVLARRRRLAPEDCGLALLIPGLIIGSAFGASLLNNAFSWVVIGAGLRAKWMASQPPI